MLGRRSYKRFKVTPSAKGVMRILRDIVVQPTRDNEWSAIAREAGVVGEILVLDIGVGEFPAPVSGPRARESSCDYRGDCSTSAASSGATRGGGSMRSGANDVFRELHGGPAVLERELRVHLLNASVSGCLVESNVRVAVGTFASIRVELDGQEYRGRSAGPPLPGDRGSRVCVPRRYAVSLDRAAA